MSIVIAQPLRVRVYLLMYTLLFSAPPVRLMMMSEKRTPINRRAATHLEDAEEFLAARLALTKTEIERSVESLYEMVNSRCRQTARAQVHRTRWRAPNKFHSGWFQKTKSGFLCMSARVYINVFFSFFSK